MLRLSSVKRMLIAFFCVVFIQLGFAFAQEECPQHEISLVGDTHYIMGEEIDLVPSELMSGSEVMYSLFKDNIVIHTSKGEDYIHVLDTPGTYILQTTIVSGECKQVFETEIVVYNDVINIIGEIDDKILKPYDKIFSQKLTLVNTIPIPPEGFYKTLALHTDKIKAGDTIIISANTVDQVLGGLIQLSDGGTFDLKEKNITIVNGMNKNLLKRIISKYTKSLDSNKLYTTDKQNFINLIASLSNQENIADSEYLTVFSLSEQKVPSYLFLSRMVDKLIYNGFPIDLIGLLLTISLAVLAVTIFRQVIGFDIFGSYTPLMAGLSVYILGIWLSLVLFFFAFVATIIVRIFTKRVYLLYSAKVSLLISLYFISIFIGLSYSQVFLSDIVNFVLFSNTFVIFPMLLIILVSEKLFYEGFKISSKGWWLSLIEFIIVSLVVYSIVESNTIQNFMLSYPEIIILVIFLIVLVGRFSGLQLLEYFRFYPLLKKNDDEEEE